MIKLSEMVNRSLEMSQTEKLNKRYKIVNKFKSDKYTVILLKYESEKIPTKRKDDLAKMDN
jgi:hypothetical protein